MFLFLYTVYFHLWFLCESDLRISCLKAEMEKLTEIRQKNDGIFSDKGFKGTVVNRALPSLHKGSLEITLTVPLMQL